MGVHLAQHLLSPAPLPPSWPARIRLRSGRRWLAVVLHVCTTLIDGMRKNDEMRRKKG